LYKKKEIILQLKCAHLYTIIITAIAATNSGNYRERAEKMKIIKVKGHECKWKKEESAGKSSKV